MILLFVVSCLLFVVGIGGGVVVAVVGIVVVVDGAVGVVEGVSWVFLLRRACIGVTKSNGQAGVLPHKRRAQKADIYIQLRKLFWGTAVVSLPCVAQSGVHVLPSNIHPSAENAHA